LENSTNQELFLVIPQTLTSLQPKWIFQLKIWPCWIWDASFIDFI